jgi:hypothetical protein
MGINAPLRLRVEGDDKDIQGTRHDSRVTKERIAENIQAAVGGKLEVASKCGNCRFVADTPISSYYTTDRSFS